MTLTRWKLLAGVLGVSMAGLAATADPPARVNPACTPRVCPVPCPAPVVAVPVVPVAFVEPPPVAVPAPPQLPPPAEQAPDLPLIPAPAKAKPAPEVAPRPRPTADADVPPIPPLSAAAPVPEVRLEPPPAPSAGAIPVRTSELPPAVVPVVTGADPLIPPPANPLPPQPQRLDPPALPSPVAQRPAPPDTPALAGNVRVVLHIGAGQPKFEVLSGDDTLLKVICDRVDVTSPSDQGQAMSALKAAGGVRLSAPGCEGTCTHLTVLPGSGDVELAGDVRVTCKQGKGETQIVASKLTFKLGTAPAYSVSDPGTVNTSFTPRGK